MQRHSPSDNRPEPAPLTPMLTAREVARLTGLATATIYEQARLHPASLGAVRIGRSVRFRRDVIEGIVGGPND